MDWVKANIQLSVNPTIIVELISPRSSISKDAVIHSEGLFYMNIDEIRKLAKHSASILRSIRAMSSDANEDVLRVKILEKLIQEQFRPKTLLESIQKIRLVDLPQK